MIQYSYRNNLNTLNHMKIISRAEFDKKVEMEFAHLTYVERMPEKEAQTKAHNCVAKEFSYS